MVTAENYNSIENPAPKTLLNFITTDKFKKKFLKSVASYIHDSKEIECNEDEITTFSQHALSCLIKVLQGNGISNNERTFLDALVNMWALDFVINEVLIDKGGDFIKTHLFWSLYSNARVRWILDEIKNGSEDQKIECISQFWDYGLYEICDDWAIDYVVLDKNMQMVQSRDILDETWTNLLMWDPEDIKKMEEASKSGENIDDINPFKAIDRNKEIIITIENGNNPVEVWNGSITNWFNRTVCERWKISGGEYHWNVIEILTSQWLVELYVMSTGECIFSQSENQVQNILDVVWPDNHKVIHFLWIYNGDKDIHFATDALELDGHLVRSSFWLHLFPYWKWAIVISYNPRSESYIMLDTYSRTIVENIMSFRNRKWEVFYGGEVPVYILDTWDIWLAYSSYNDDNTETLGHFSTIEYWDKHISLPPTLKSPSPSKYNN